MAEQKGSMAILKDFFGYKPGTGLKEFGAEVKALSDDEKTYLVTEAAKQMGVEVKA